MRILDRYIGLGYLFSCFLSLVAFILFYIIGDLFGHLDDIINNHVPIWIIFSYYVSMIPVVAVNVSSLASLLSGLYVLGTMGYGNEIIAIRSAGKSLFFILRSILASSLLLCSIIFFINERFVPKAVVFTNTVKRDFIKRNQSNKKDIVLKYLTFYGRDNRLFFISKFYPKKNLLKGIVILVQDEDQRIIRKLVARQAHWENGYWVFDNLVVCDFNKEGNPMGEKKYYKHKKLKLEETPSDIVKSESFIDSLNIKSLIMHIKRLEKSKATDTILTFKVQVLYRIISAISPLVLLIAGLPFMLRIQRKPPGFSVLGMGIVLFLVYYISETVAISVAKLGLCNPLYIVLPIPIGFMLLGILYALFIP